ncbi:hypothetical protein CDAR_448891 [Caerostris darwini]|uniref:Uncharacterized protein n=1 Tax=Caerostris darwini TaxID=1538125 RepID=A0AAV4WCC9_9ARAC|nr:hypothetical protein CDAR_448891 [Caerostris darwini]
MNLSLIGAIEREKNCCLKYQFGGEQFFLVGGTQRKRCQPREQHVCARGVGRQMRVPPQHDAGPSSVFWTLTDGRGSGQRGKRFFIIALQTHPSLCHKVSFWVAGKISRFHKRPLFLSGLFMGIFFFSYFLLSV